MRQTYVYICWEDAMKGGPDMAAGGKKNVLPHVFSCVGALNKETKDYIIVNVVVGNNLYNITCTIKKCCILTMLYLSGINTQIEKDLEKPAKKRKK